MSGPAPDSKLPEPGPTIATVSLQSHLHLAPATMVLGAFTSRELSPVEYLEALLKRAEALAPEVNCFGDVYAQDARRLARAAGERYAQRAEPLGPLEGLPIAVKDEASIAGRRTTNGSLLWVERVMVETEPFLERLVRAGAIVHARTLTPEFSVAFWTASRLWGATRNPWNLDLDVGGSSGGSGAALAAGLTPVATGSDIGGSVRVPASCCGVVGYKPTFGRIPQPGPFGLDPWSHLGLLARSVADVALVTDQVVGPHRGDHGSLRPALRIGAPVGDVRGLRVGVSEDLGDWPVVEAVRAATRAVAETLAGIGARVEPVALTVERSLLRRASDAHHKHNFAASVAETVSGHTDEVTPYVLEWLRSLDAAPSVLAGLQAEAEIQARVGAALETVDVLVCPTIAIPAFTAGIDYSSQAVVIDGRSYDALHDICLTEVFNVASRCPVLTVPAGRDVSGAPIGLQIVGRTYDDPTVFAVARALEIARPWPLGPDMSQTPLSQTPLSRTQ